MTKKLMTIMPIALLLICILMLYYDPLHSVENVIYDNVLQQERAVTQKIVIVGIDERSIDEIGTWPWPRIYVSDTLDKLLDLGAAAIGVDILYDSYGANEEYDQKLIDAVGRSDKVILATMGVFSGDAEAALIAEDYVVPFDELYEVAKTGFINVIPDASDGIVRKGVREYSYGETTVSSFPIEIYKTYCRSLGISERLSIPTNKFGQYVIDYVAPAGSYTEVSLWGVLHDEYPPQLFQDAIVLIGPFAPGVGNDSFYTPLDHGDKTYGIELHANTIQNFLENNIKSEAAWYWNIIPLIIIFALSIIFYRRLKPVWILLLSVIMVVLQLLGAKILYDRLDLVIISVYSLLYIVLGYLINLVLTLLHTQQEKAHIHGLFGRFVSPEVVKEIIDGNISISLGGTLKEVSLLFVDIRGFTAFSEANPPEKVVEMVNRYLELTSNSIQSTGGTIDKYIGDATMAVFNAPNPLPDHPLCAVKAAWAMKVGSESLRNEILADFGVDLQFGIGVNTGYAVVGNMGSTFRMDYTVIGDTVNTAARLESNAAKGQIIISDSTYQAVKDYVEVKDLGLLSVKNKKEGIHVYEVMGMKP